MITAFRYLVIRALSFPVPGLVNSIPIFGGRTVLEFLLFSGGIILLILFGCKNGFTTGVSAEFIGAFMTIAAMRKFTLYTWLFGISFERALFWHKIGAMLFMAVVLIHAIQIKVNGSGLVLAALIVVMSIAYLLMSKFFEWFYYFHITIFAVVCIVSLIHGATAISVVGLLWLVDLVVRYCITAKTIVDGEARVLPGQVTHIRFKKCFPYLPGQYCFLRIEVLDAMQYHPFSLASSPDQEHTSFYCRALARQIS